MKILLVDLTAAGKQSKMNFKPLGLLKLSTYHKEIGNEVKFTGFNKAPKYFKPDLICFSPLFFFRIKSDIGYIKSFMKKYPNSKIQIGGLMATIKPDIFKKYLGNNIELIHGLYEPIENKRPDYSLFDANFAFGFTTRGCIRKCPWCIVPTIEGKIRKDENWHRYLSPKLKMFYAMDNNVLAAGPDWFESILKEMDKRKYTIEFNQGMDCILFAKNSRFIEILSKYKHVFHHIRFSWDSKHQKKAAIETLEMMKKAKINCDKTWYMLYGNGETPEEIYDRISIILSYKNKIKPMIYRDFETGKKPDNYSRYLSKYLSHIFITGIISYDNPIKLGRNIDEFLRLIALGETIKDNVLKDDLKSLIKYMENK